MRANRQKVLIARARSCLSVSDIIAMSELPRATINRAINGMSVAPETMGKVARALGVDVLDILEDSSEEGE